MFNKVDLKNNNSYEWYCSNEINVKGFAFDQEGKFLTDGNLADKFTAVSSLKDFQIVVETLNGVFSIVINMDDRVYLAVDINRTFPLFYTKQNGKWFISDDANHLQKEFNLNLSSEAKKEFTHTGYVTGKNTLLENLFQVQAAEVVELAQDKTTEEEYWTYASNNITDKDFKELQAELLAIYERLTKRLIQAAQGKTIVIPLSGGYDSRLVLALLLKQNYKNLHCFTYGVKSSFEVKIAKKVADKLNVKLEVIEYNNTFIDTYFDKDEFFDYIKFGANYVSLSHVQDFLAVKYLYRNNLMPSDSIIAPGHSGDIFAGTHISKNINDDSAHELAKSEINKRHYSLNSGCSANINYYNESCFPYSNMEAWSWKERQAKFIVNSLRIYDYFGYKSALPLWDKELAEFFKAIPLKLKNRNFIDAYKIENNLYDSVNFTVFNQLGIDLIKKDRFILLNKVVFRIKRMLGKLNDPINNFDYLFSVLSRYIVLKEDSPCTNSLAAKYYIQILKGDTLNDN